MKSSAWQPPKAMTSTCIGYHYENHLLAVNLFHMRGGKVLDRREFFWEELGELESAVGFDVGEFFSTLLKQLYLDAPYIPRTIYVPVDFEDREALEELLSEKRGSRVHIEVPQRGDKRSLIDLAGNNAKQSYDQRFRVMKPRTDVLKSVLAGCLPAAGAARRALSASTSRTSRARRPWPPWWCGKTAR